jgi:tetratricopeptide (TPR) repeat protein
MMMPRSLPLLLVGLLLVGSGCGANRKPITERDRKEAATLISEAQFAMSVREWQRAEGLLAKAVQLVPDGDVYITLGSARVRLNDRNGAKDAYRNALKLYEDEAARNTTRSDPWLKQIYVLALLGRPDDSRATAVKALKKFPNDARVKSFSDPKQFERMTSAPSFKDMAL